jgi:hypothetical protein
MMGTFFGTNPKMNDPALREAAGKAWFAARDLIRKYDLLRLYEFADQGGRKVLTIGNLWRLESVIPEIGICFYQYSFFHDRWIDVSWKRDHLWAWPRIPLLPFSAAKDSGWAFKVLEQVVSAVFQFAAAGFSLSRDTEKHFPYYVSVENLLWKFFIPQSRYKRVEGQLRDAGRRGGRLEPREVENQARELQEIFRRHFLDQGLAVNILKMLGRPVDMVEYLKYQPYRNALAKVRRRHGNLMPLLQYIRPKFWIFDDLFYHRLWLKAGRRQTDLRWMVYPRFHTNDDYMLKPFETEEAWEFFLKMSPVLSRNFNADYNWFLENLAAAEIRFRAPAAAYEILMKHNKFLKPGRDPLLQHIMRLFIHHCYYLWQESGYQELKSWLKAKGEAELKQVMVSYSNSPDFNEKRFQRKNTWPSLIEEL